MKDVREENQQQILKLNKNTKLKQSLILLQLLSRREKTEEAENTRKFPLRFLLKELNKNLPFPPLRLLQMKLTQFSNN